MSCAAAASYLTFLLLSTRENSLLGKVAVLTNNAPDKWIPLKSLLARTNGVVIDDGALCIDATDPDAWIDAFVVFASLVIITIFVDLTLESASSIWIAEKSWLARAYTTTTGALHVRIGTARVGNAGIHRLGRRTRTA